MSEDNGAGGRPSWWVLTLIVGVALQAAGFGVWIGSIQTQSNSNTEWIKGRDNKNVDVRLSVLENEHTAMKQQVDRLDDKLSSHIATDNVLMDRLNEQHRQGNSKP